MNLKEIRQKLQFAYDCLDHVTGTHPEAGLLCLGLLIDEIDDSIARGEADGQPDPSPIDFDQYYED